jgi:tetratricopeptide (TPR) repeat protein/peroxiredoxin
MKEYVMNRLLRSIVWIFIIVLVNLGTTKTSQCQNSGESHFGDIVGEKDKTVQYGISFPIQYELSESAFIGVKDAPQVVDLLMYRNMLDTPDTLRMFIKEGIWETGITVSDTSIKMILIAFQIHYSPEMRTRPYLDTNMGKYWDFLLQDRQGKPVRGAHQARSLSYTGLGGKREENLVLSLSEIHKELTIYPDNYPARNLLYTILLRQNENDDVTRYAIKKEIDSILGSHLQDEEVMRFALGGYRMIGEMEEAKKVEDVLIQLHPKSDQAAMKAFGEIIQLEDTPLRMQRMQQFLLDFPDTRFAEYALTNIATAVIASDDSIQMITIGDKIYAQSTTLAAASGLAGIAGTLVEKRYELDRAIAYIQKAILLIRMTGASIRPPEVSSSDWEDRIQKTEARYRDILGWAMIQQGKWKEGISELKTALGVSQSPTIHFHLAQALEKIGSFDEAIDHYAKTYAFGGEVGEKANQAFDSLWVRTERNPSEKESFLQGEIKQINDIYREKILSRGEVREASDFELEDLRGGWVRLSDQQGGVVLLCFWATWSQSSQRLFRTLNQLSEMYEKDVLFLTVAMDIELDPVKKFIKENRIAFPVLINDDTDKKYGLEGVPVIFVIDEKRNIRFEHRGYRPDINEMLVIELDYLLNQ